MDIAIKEHGMLYKAEMVQAIMRSIDPKTQTRRPITFNNSTTDGAVKRKEWHLLDWDNAKPWTVEIPTGYSKPFGIMRLPAWRVPFKGGIVTVRPRVWPGHLIWVRETWQVMRKHNELWLKGDYITCHGMPMKEKPTYEHYVIFKADDRVESIDQSFCWRSSMLMPRWASRIDLNVLGMRSERIQDISEHDAKAEGVEKMHLDDLGQTWATYKRGFQTLWDSINVARGFGWDANHPVWIHNFKRVELT